MATIKNSENLINLQLLFLNSDKITIFQKNINKIGSVNPK